MCSISEAWGDSFNSTNNGGVPKQMLLQQETLNAERVGQLHTQSDDHRQYAKPSSDVFPTRFSAKSSSQANGLTRGVHTKYSREKRIDLVNHPDKGGFTGLQSDVDPSYFRRDESQRPEYLDLYEKPFEEFAGSAVTNGPAPLNSVTEKYSSLITSLPDKQAKQITNAEYFAPAKEKFAPVNKDLSAEIVKLQEQVAKLSNNLNAIELDVKTLKNDKSHDIVLYIVIAIFILFILDSIFRSGRRTS